MLIGVTFSKLDLRLYAYSLFICKSPETKLLLANSRLFHIHAHAFQLRLRSNMYCLISYSLSPNVHLSKTLYDRLKNEGEGELRFMYIYFLRTPSKRDMVTVRSRKHHLHLHNSQTASSVIIV